MTMMHHLFVILLLILTSQSVKASQSSLSSPNNKPLNVIIVGGSSGMGKAAAIATVRRGGNAFIVSRSQDKLHRAAKEIKSKAAEYFVENDTEESSMIGSVKTVVLDVTNEEAVSKFVQTHLITTKSTTQEDDDKSSSWDGLVFSAAGKAPHGSITTLETHETRQLFETKFWGAYLCSKYMSPHLSNGGSIVFVGGVLNRRPGINCSPLASTNGALEGLTRALALELGPKLRVNCLSPGFCDTERFDHMEAGKKDAMLKNTAESLPLKRVGMPEDMGEAIYYLLQARFCTGVVLDCDGGHHIRQYANPNTDPMRK